MAAYLSEEGHALVSAAVARAEAQSAGEIVTILTDRSDGYSDIALVWSILAGFAAIVALSVAPEFYLGVFDWLLGNWGEEWTNGELFAIAAAFGIIKFAGMLLLQMWQPLKFWLIPRPIRAARVRARALTCYRIGAERRTTGRTGILIYLSMREHRAEIVADEAIAAEVGPQAWEGAMAAMLAHLREGRMAEGMAAGVEQVGTVLAQHCPRRDDDSNELPDRLIEV